MEIRNIGVNVTGSISRHDHSSEGVHEFHYFLNGGGTFTNCGVDYRVRPGTLFFSKPTDIHQADEDREGPAMIIYNLSFAPRYPDDLAFMSLLEKRFTPDASASIGKGYGLLFEDLRRKSVDPDPLMRLSAQHRFLAFVYEILGGQVREHPLRGQLYVDEALNIMQESITGSLDLDALVLHLGIEKSYFIRLFKQVVGMPPVRYFINLKMEAARNSLSDMDKTVRQVAAELGYEDEFYFSRQFKATIGLSPRAFRKGR